MNISIAMTYFNRPKQLSRTLKSLDFFKENLSEVVIVDDGSDQPISDFIDINNFNYRIIVYRIPPEKKTYMNCCVPFNLALRECLGDAVIIQNAECYHAGDILSYVQRNIKLNKYLSFSCYSLGTQNTAFLPEFSNFSREEFLNFNKQFLSKLPHRTAEGWGDQNTWYNHPEYRPCDLHFTTAIMNEDLQDLNYFDERYSQCVAFDDNEFLTRIKRKGMEIERVSEPWSVHQFHRSTNYFRGQMCEQLYNEVTLKEKIWRAPNELPFFSDDEDFDENILNPPSSTGEGLD